MRRCESRSQAERWQVFIQPYLDKVTRADASQLHATIIREKDLNVYATHSVKRLPSIDDEIDIRRKVGRSDPKRLRQSAAIKAARRRRDQKEKVAAEAKKYGAVREGRVLGKRD